MKHQNFPTFLSLHQRDSKLVAIEKYIEGQSLVMEHIRRQVRVIAPSIAPVLITGKTGTGKERVAQALHQASDRHGHFVAINCAAIPSDLVEAELFGYEKGAFTGADFGKIGLLEQANHGTLFLDEIGDLPKNVQAKLLRVLENRKISRLGSSHEVDLDFRLVSATHKDLMAGSAVNFRTDLFFRIAVFHISLPALSQRISDLNDLVDSLVQQLLRQGYIQKAPTFDKAAIRRLSVYEWPGNTRELKNFLMRASIPFPGQDVTKEMIEEILLINRPLTTSKDYRFNYSRIPKIPGAEDFKLGGEVMKDLDIRRYLRDIEVALIEGVLEKMDGCVSKAAKALNLKRTTLIEKIRKYSIVNNP